MTGEEIKKQKELEEVIIGTVLIDNSVLDDFYFDFGISPDLFYFENSRIMYQAIIDMHNMNIEINDVSFSSYLANLKVLDKVGGINHILSLKKDYATGNTEYYLNSLRCEFQKRETIRIMKENTETLQDVTKKPDAVIAQIVESLSKLVDITNETKYLTMYDQYDLLKKTTDEQIEKGGGHTGILSGFHVLDDATDGFQRGELAILAARPSIGKTSMALTMCMNISTHNNCAFISLETPAKTIAQKVASLITDVSNYRLKTAFLSQGDYQKVFIDSQKEFERRNFFLVDKPFINITELRSVIRHLVMCNKVEMVFIDYIGLVDAGNEDMPVYQKQSIVSKAIKGMAREFNIAICALCQVSRENEKSENIPTLANLRGSGSIEQDADVVIFLHGKRIIPKEEMTIDRDFIVAKNRNGECVASKVTFDKITTKYFDKLGD